MIQLKEEEIEHLKQLEQNIIEAKNNLRDYQKKIIRDVYNLKTPTIGIASYNTKIYRYFKVIKQIDYLIPAYIYSYDVIGDHIVPRYCHITKNGKCGNSLTLDGKCDFTFTPLDEFTTLEQVQKIIKQIKKENKNNNVESVQANNK